MKTIPVLITLAAGSLGLATLGAPLSQTTLSGDQLSVPPGQAKVLWWDDFESYRAGQLNLSKVGGGPGPYDRQQNCQGFDHPGEPGFVPSAATGKESQVISRVVAFNGAQAIKFLRNFGDQMPHAPPRKTSPRYKGDDNPYPTARNELVTPELWKDGDDVWIGYALFLASKPEYGAKGRWRNTPGANRTVLINQVTTGQPVFFFRLNWDTDGGNYCLNCDKVTASEPLRWDEWNTIVLRLLWQGEGGKVQVWQNGSKVIDMDRKHPQGCAYYKFKFGEYANTPAEGVPQVAFFDDLKIAVGTNLLDFVTPKRAAHNPASARGGKGSAGLDSDNVRPNQGDRSAAPRQTGRNLPGNTRTFLDVPYATSGHERQKLDLYIPGNAKNPPMVLCVHGGGWKQGTKSNPRGLRELLEAGFAVASINYRYSQQAVFPAQLEDCKSAVRWLRANAAKYGVNSEHIGAWGGSAGGHLVALLGTTGSVQEFDVGENLEFSSRVQAVCDWYGPTDFLQMDAQVPRGVKAMKHNPASSPESLLIGGPIQEHPDRVRRANPITYITKGVPPFLIFHGEQDTSVAMGQSQILADALKQAGTDVTFETIPDDGHGLRKNGPALVPQSVEFFVKHLREARP
jgi:acetyl esterase/lipase